MTVRVDVTAEDLRHGVPFSPLYCPVARAIRRATGEAWLVRAGWMRREDVAIGLPREASDAVKRFDMGKRVRPFSFEVEVSG
jgi:hypothetical protein